jgi:hypothetical protein
MPLNALGALGGITSAGALNLFCGLWHRRPHLWLVMLEFKNASPKQLPKKRRRRDMREPSTSVLGQDSVMKQSPGGATFAFRRGPTIDPPPHHWRAAKLLNRKTNSLALRFGPIRLHSGQACRQKGRNHSLCSPGSSCRAQIPSYRETRHENSGSKIVPECSVDTTTH